MVIAVCALIEIILPLFFQPRFRRQYDETLTYTLISSLHVKHDSIYDSSTTLLPYISRISISKYIEGMKIKYSIKYSTHHFIPHERKTCTRYQDGTRPEIFDLFSIILVSMPKYHTVFSTILMLQSFSCSTMFISCILVK